MKEEKTRNNQANGDMLLLVVEDDRIIQALHKRVVKEVVPNLAVITCKHGGEALNYIQSSKKRHFKFLVLLDINMPVMNGWEFLRQCEKKQIENIKVVMVSSSVNDADRATAAAFPTVFRYCEKPLTKVIFTEILQQKEVKGYFGPFLKEG